MEYDVMNFEMDVIEESYKIPQVVDFWAPWCQPCRILGPVLEKLAAGANGRWQLKKLNVDENQSLAAQFGVKGIPAVKLVVNGKVISEFTGALPEQQITDWLNKNIPDENDELLKQAESLLASGDEDGASKIAENILASVPDHSKAAWLLGKLHIFSQPDRAHELLTLAAKDPQMVDEVQYLLDFSGMLGSKEEDLQDDPVKNVVLEGLQQLQKKDFDTGLEKLIKAVMINKNYHDDLPRKMCIAVFKLLGDQHDITRKYRRRFDMALY